jgi:hypothetical protein
MPPTRTLEKHDFPAITIDTTGPEVSVSWKSEISLSADRTLECVLPITFIGPSKSFVALLTIKDRDNVIVQTTGTTVNPEETDSVEFVSEFQLGRVPKGNFDYEFVLQRSGEIVGSARGRIVSK